MRAELYDRDRLSRDGWGWRAVERMQRTGELIAVRRGVFVRADAWRSASSAHRALLRAHALAMTTVDPGVFSHETAAAAHGLPIVRVDGRVHTTDVDERGSARAEVVRHRGPLTADDIVDVGPLRCTSLPRTLADLARTSRCETSVVALDAALRAANADAEHLREAVSEIAARSAHGRRRAESRIRFADAAADSPGESVSRIHLVCLGFTVQTQVVVPSRGSLPYRVDFDLDGVLGEFDGAVKYSDAALLDGKDARAVLMDEKRREDWIRATTGRQLVRWQWGDIASAATLERHLGALGVRPRQVRGAFVTAGREVPAPR